MSALSVCLSVCEYVRNQTEVPGRKTFWQPTGALVTVDHKILTKVQGKARQQTEVSKKIQENPYEKGNKSKTQKNEKMGFS